MKLGKYTNALFSTKGGTSGDKAKPKKPTKVGVVLTGKNMNRSKDARMAAAAAELQAVWK